MARPSSRSAGASTASHSSRTPRATASTGSRLRVRSSQAAIDPAAWASATRRSARVVRPLVASPRRVTEAVRGEHCLVGVGDPDNYKTLVVACMADGHDVLAYAPIDVNIQKQLTILMTEMGLPAERIVMLPGDASLGYGIEYEYSIMERIRLAALQGDAMLSRPVMAVVGEQAWKAKEARLAADEMPEWGEAAKRGPAWEAATAAVFLQAGADIVALLHPDAVRSTQRTIAELVGSPAE